MVSDMEKIERVFEDRVNELEVARILQLIGQLPNKHEKAQRGDMPGAFDLWFDGGACRFITGHTEYVFEDGSKASVLVTPTLSVLIEFPDGLRVEIRQTN
jgi:hypothetical protein